MKTYPPIARCSECKGACCRNVPGISYPQEYGSPPQVERIAERLLTRRWCIDWWEESKELPKTYYVRPSIVSPKGWPLSPDWMGQCGYLGKDGCSCPPEWKPLGCRAVKPSEEVGNCKGLDKFHGAKKWRKYQKVILRAIEMIEGE